MMQNQQKSAYVAAANQGQAPTGVNPNIDTLARTIYGEARGEGVQGMQAVANVVMNRVAAGQGTPAEVCLAPYQFSCWLPGNPNLSVILAVTTADPVFVEAMQIAAEAVAGTLPDITGGAVNYYNPSLVNPSWAGSMRVTARIGNQVFGVA